MKTPKTKQPLSSALWIRLVFIQKKKKGNYNLPTCGFIFDTLPTRGLFC